MRRPSGRVRDPIRGHRRSPAYPSRITASAIVLSQEMIEKEHTVFQRALLTRATRVRFRLVTVSLTMGMIDAFFDVLPGAWQILVGASVLLLLANELVALLSRRGAADERHLFAMQLLDSIMLAILIVLFGEQGYLGIPFVIFATSGYAMGHERAAWRQYLMGCLIYPVARVLGLHSLDGGVSVWPVVLETLCLAVLGWMSMQGPVRYINRVRRARQALGDLERGDFSVRLPTRALDDVGFLGASFNVTAAALGSAVRTLEDEVEERSRAEESMRAARHEATRMAERMSAVAEAAGGVIASDSPTALRDVLRESCEHVLELNDFALALVDADAARLQPIDDSADPKSLIAVKEGGNLWRVLHERRTIVSYDYHALDEAFRTPTVGTVMHTPVLLGHDVAAVITVSCAREWAYAEADVAVFEALGALTATALRNILLVGELRSSREALSHQAHHDGLTGLANRRRFRERVLQACTDCSPKQVAILALDLDGFKGVNDSLGHAAGDQVLQQVSERLLNATRGCDVVARLGGDEFAILLSHVPDEAHAVVVAERILRAIGSPFSIANRLVSIGTSIGIALGIPGVEEDESMHVQTQRTDPGRDYVDVLLHEADVALYRAKSSGKSCWVIFESSMHEEERALRKLDLEMRQALANDSLQLLFQPIHSLENGVLRGVEAQLRWDHPERGVMSPSVWLPLAEQSGFILELGHWMLGRACRSAAAWHAWQREHQPRSAPLTIAVGVSIRQLHHETFVDEVRAVLTESGLAPSSLVLELSETALLRAPVAARHQLQRLHDLGVRIAIDDFGMGSSSLGYLQGLAVDVLKIDRSFVQGVARGGSQTALTRTILALGEALSLETVAKGVDHEQQRASLQALGCGLGQGTRFARAMGEQGIAELLGDDRVEAWAL